MTSGGPEPDEADRFTRRAFLIGAVQAGAFGLLVARLYQLQVMEGRRYAPLAEDNRIGQRGLVPRRGLIFDRAGTLLAANEETFRVGILPGSKTEMRRHLEALARIIPLPSDEIDRLLSRARNAPRNLPLTVQAELNFEQAAQIGLLAPHLPGIEVETEPRRRYLNGHATGHVVGYVGSVDRHALGDDPFLKLPHVKVGKAGVELGMDSELRGTGGSRRFEVDARGRVLRHLEETPPAGGGDVTVTIDTALQEKVYARISGERRAAVVAVDVATGEVVVLASVPTFDPNDLAADFDEDTWQRLQNDSNKPLLNRVIAGQYPPGSTFKMVTALAALEAGVVSLDERIACSGTYHYADQSYRCWRREGHGRSDFTRALRESCDVYFYELARRTGIGRIADMAHKLGLGQTYASGLGLQKTGIVPDPGWKRATLGKNWLGGETILAGIGQGYVLATPLQLAVMTARLATGRAVVPTLVRRPSDRLPDSALFPQLDIRPDWLDAVRTAMVSVVNEAGGTGGNASLTTNAVVIAGKTGTSQVTSSAGVDPDDMAWEHRDHALFVSYFPALTPRYAIATVVEHGGGGGTAAAPIVRDVIQLLIDNDPIARAQAVSPASPAAAGTVADGHP